MMEKRHIGVILFAIFGIMTLFSFVNTLRIIDLIPTVEMKPMNWIISIMMVMLHSLFVQISLSFLLDILL